jgi:hypothetical protein
MAEKKKKAGTLAGKTKDGKKVYGPFKGSDKNGGRPMMSVVNADGSRTSVDAARYKYEKTHGKLKSKDQTVDHKDNNHSNDKSSNLRVLSRSKNTAKENKRRAGKKENEK